MQILGFHKLSLVDYPKKLSSVIFTGGCNFNCPYCHNKNIVNQTGDHIDEEELEKILLRRKKYVSTLCISGGEPTLQNDLVDFIEKYKKIGFDIKLDTNGSNPEVLKELLKKNCLDYVAMDIKTDIHDYKAVIGKYGFEEKIMRSINLLKESTIDYEFRTTFVKELITEESIKGLKIMVENSKRFVLQRGKLNDDVLEPNTNMRSFTAEEMEQLRDEFTPLAEEIRLNL